VDSIGCCLQWVLEADRAWKWWAGWYIQSRALSSVYCPKIIYCELTLIPNSKHQCALVDGQDVESAWHSFTHWRMSTSACVCFYCCLQCMYILWISDYSVLDLCHDNMSRVLFCSWWLTLQLCQWHHIAVLRSHLQSITEQKDSAVALPYLGSSMSITARNMFIVLHITCYHFICRVWASLSISSADNGLNDVVWLFQLLKQSSIIIADADDDSVGDDTGASMTADPASLPDIENLMSACQLALDEEIHKMNEVSLCICLLAASVL